MFDAGYAIAPALSVSARTRVTPFHDRVVAAGAKAFTVYNRMLLPTVFESLEDDYWHLRAHVQIWDVSVERQIALRGPDALRLAQMMTPRNLAKLEVGRCMYVPLVNAAGGLINDPVLLRPDADTVWLSIADSDVMLWAQGLAYGLGLDVTIGEADVWPLAVQGPKAVDLMADVFGADLRDLRKFRFARFPFQGHALLIARSGWSRQGGFEIYVEDRSIATGLWDTLLEAGRAHDVRAGCPNLIERIESGLLSYGNDVTVADTPLMAGLGRFCDLDGDFDFVGKSALLAERAAGVRAMLRGVVLEAPFVPNLVERWPVVRDGQRVGDVRSAAYSPRFEAGIGLAMLSTGACKPNTTVTIDIPGLGPVGGRVTDLPMMDTVAPLKHTLASSAPVPEGSFDVVQL